MDFIALAQECAPWVAPQTLAAIVKTESVFNPLAIGVNNAEQLTRQPRTPEEAEATARWLINNGHNIDLGLGQINSSNLSKTGLSIKDAFDPCKNLAAAATILEWNYHAAVNKYNDEQDALRAALSAYNTGSFTKGYRNGYVQKVINNNDVVAENKMNVPELLSKKTSIEFSDSAVVNNYAQTETEPVKVRVEKNSEPDAPQSPTETQEQPDNHNIYQTGKSSALVY